MERRIVALVAGACMGFALVTVACEDTTPSGAGELPGDRGGVVTPPAPSDAGREAGADAGADAASDAGADAGRDAS